MDAMPEGGWGGHLWGEPPGPLRVSGRRPQTAGGGPRRSASLPVPALGRPWGAPLSPHVCPSQALHAWGLGTSSAARLAPGGLDPAATPQEILRKGLQRPQGGGCGALGPSCPRIVKGRKEDRVGLAANTGPQAGAQVRVQTRTYALEGRVNGAPDAHAPLPQPLPYGELQVQQGDPLQDQQNEERDHKRPWRGRGSMQSGGSSLDCTGHLHRRLSQTQRISPSTMPVVTASGVAVGRAHATS